MFEILHRSFSGKLDLYSIEGEEWFEEFINYLKLFIIMYSINMSIISKLIVIYSYKFIFMISFTVYNQ